MNEKINCATRADVAKRAGVSVTVVSYVMNNNRYVDSEKRERVLKAARELNYTPNNVALALRGKNSSQILFIVDSPANERLSRLMKIMDDLAYSRGALVSQCSTRSEPEFVRNVIRRRFDGVIISSMQLSEEYIQELVKANIPTVLLLSHEYKNVQGVGKIGTGLKHGAKAAVKLLYEKDCRNFLYVDRISTRNHFSDMSDSRLSGFAEACTELGLEWENRIITGCDSSEMLQKKVAEFVSAHQVDAVIGRNDPIACYAMHQLQKMGKRIPEDVQVIGFDNSSVCNLVTPTLSSVQMSDDEVCREAIDLIYSIRSGEKIPPTKHFPIHIIERGSTR